MPTRRTFLGAAAAAPLALTRAAAAPNDSTRLGFIGVGTMGRGHLGGFLGRKGVEVVAICDVVKERRDDALARVNKAYAARAKSGTPAACQVTNDFRGVLERKDVDAVLIATPDHWHAQACILAARAGKHIYCEKPLTHAVAEGRQIVDEVAKAKVAFQTGSQQRSEFGNRFRAAVEMVWNGWIGKVKTVRIGVGGPPRACDLPAQDVPPGTDWDAWQGPAPERAYHEKLCPKGVHQHFPEWRAYREYAGGGLADMGAHHFDIAQWALKKDGTGPVDIIPPADPKKGAGLRFVYADGVVMIHDEFEKDVRADCVFEGETGTILVGRGQLDVRMKDGGTVRFPEKPERVMASASHHGNWLEAVRTGSPTICPAEVGHRTATICHLAEIGYRLGRKLKWDPAAEKFVGDAAADKELTKEPRGKWKLT